MTDMDEDIRRASEIIRKGGVILYPTDTIWGIGCDASNEEAVRRVYSIKRRADSKALIVLLGSEDELWRYVDDVPDIALELIEVSDRPTTVIYDRGRNLAQSVLADDGSVAVRVTREKFSAKLCRACRRPLVSTSANISGEKSPLTFRQISDEIISQVDYVVSFRRDEEDEDVRPSVIIKISSDSTFKIIRS